MTEISQTLYTWLLVFATIGALFIFKQLCHCLSWWKTRLHCHQNLFTKYGQPDSWVVVTGGSDGIGLEMSHQLASQGFNICIVGRSESKINEKLKHIQTLNPYLKTKCIVFDFQEHTKISDYKEKIALQLNDLDVAILCLNAGFAQIGAFCDITDMDVHKQVSVNAV